MVFLDTKLYLRYITKKCNVKYSNSLIDILYYYIDIVKDNGYRLDFHWWRHASFKRLNCNAGYGKYSSIVATPGWAAKLVLSDSKEIHNAFLMSLGHEISHKNNDMIILRGLFVKNGLKFIAYMNEVYADFEASAKFWGGYSNIQVQAMEYKLTEKIQEGKEDFATNNHPSWSYRIGYVKRKIFDESLIRKIADDVNCTNEKLIQKAINHFEEIYLS